jgi:hypothetical protein
MAPHASWNRADSSTPAVSPAPTSAAEIVDIVKKHAEFPCPVRAVGELHSTTACLTAQGGTLIRMRGMKQVHVNDDRTVMAEAGATMLEVRDALRVVGRELAVSPEIGNATAGSVACGGTKDSTLNFETRPGLSQIGSLVKEVELVDGRGHLLKVTDAGAVDLTDGNAPVPGLDLSLVRCSYGLLGIVTRVTFETLPLQLLENQFHMMELWTTESGQRRLRRIDEIFDGADAVLGFLDPYRGNAYGSGQIFMERRRKDSPAPWPAPLSESDQIRRGMRDWMWEWGGHVAAASVADFARALQARHPVAAVARVIATALAGGIIAVVRATGVAAPAYRALLPPGLEAAVDLPATKSMVTEMLLPILNPPGTTMEGLFENVLGLHARLPRPPLPIPEMRFDWMIDLLGEMPGPVLAALGTYLAYRSDSLVDFTRNRYNVFDFTFWAFPQSQWSTVIPAYIDFCEQIKDGPRPLPHDPYPGYPPPPPGFRPTLFTEVYFTGRDDKSYLAFAWDGPAFTLDMVHNLPDDIRWKQMSHRYNAWAVAHGGRPLFNQTKHLDTTPGVKALLRKAFMRGHDDRWQTFSALVRAKNPAHGTCARGRFVNEYFDSLLLP